MTFLAQICPEMGKLPNYMWYFGSNNVEGVAEILVEAESSWVEVGARFSDTQSFTTMLKNYWLSYFFCKNSFISIFLMKTVAAYIYTPVPGWYIPIYICIPYM